MKWLLSLVIMTIFLSMFSSAFTIDNDNLGTFQKDECVNLIQNCANCSYVNITSIMYPDSTEAIGSVEMTKAGTLYTYSFCNTTELGSYIVSGFGDMDGNGEVWSYNFEVTLSGNEPPEAITIVFFVLIFLTIFVVGIIYFFRSLAYLSQLELDLNDAVIMVSTYLAMFFFYYFSREYLGNILINDILEIAISVGAITHVFLPLVGFLLSFILTNLKAKQKSRITY